MYILFVMLFCLYINAADDSSWYNTIENKPITQENVLALSEQLPYVIEIAHWPTPAQDDAFGKIVALAHYARFKEIAANMNFKYLRMFVPYYTRLSGRPAHLSDTNYAIWREHIPGLVKLADMSKPERVIVRKAITSDALREMHAAIIYAGLKTHANKNLYVHREGTKVIYYINPLEQVGEQFKDTFYYQGPKGQEQYVRNVVDSLDSMIYGKTRDEPRSESLTYGGLQEGNQIALWKRLTQEHEKLLALCAKHNYWPQFLERKQPAQD